MPIGIFHPDNARVNSLRGMDFIVAVYNNKSVTVKQVGVYGFVFWRDTGWASVIVDELVNFPRVYSTTNDRFNSQDSIS
jgi:hypothetical protein